MSLLLPIFRAKYILFTFDLGWSPPFNTLKNLFLYKYLHLLVACVTLFHNPQVFVFHLINFFYPKSITSVYSFALGTSLPLFIATSAQMVQPAFIFTKWVALFHSPLYQSQWYKSYYKQKKSSTHKDLYHISWLSLPMPYTS